jgi:hypothetical protein
LCVRHWLLKLCVERAGERMAFKLSPEDQEFLTPADVLLQQFSQESIQNNSLDFLAYRIYLDPLQPSNEFSLPSPTFSPSSSSSSSHSPYKESHENIQRILKVRDVAMDYLQELTQEYIWHQDPFQIKIILEKDGTISLGGIVEFDNNIEDEWFVVYLLFELSKQFPIMSISVTDMDGEFLLIESAACIPDWLGPENSENRVWIRHGKLHIIPLDEPGRTRNGSMQLHPALNCLRTSRSRTSKGILKCLLSRISQFPASGRANLHRSTCLLPSKVAQLLTMDPQLVSVAVNTLCQTERDKFYSKTLKAMEYFDPSQERAGEELVPVTVIFTRALFAQLTFLQRFHLPQKFHQTQSRLQQTLAATAVAASSPSSSSSSSWNAQTAKAFDLGARLTCGLELAYQKSKLQQATFHQQVEEMYAKKVSSLTRLGFDSQKLTPASYSSLLNEMVCVQDTLTVDRIRSQFESSNVNGTSGPNGVVSGQHFNDSLGALKSFLDSFRAPLPFSEKIDQMLLRAEEGEEVVVRYSAIHESESEDWLHLSPEEFEKNMEERIALITRQDEEEKKRNPPSPASGPAPIRLLSSSSSSSVTSSSAPSPSSHKSPTTTATVAAATTTTPSTEPDSLVVAAAPAGASRKSVNTLYSRPPPTALHSLSHKPPLRATVAVTSVDYDSDDDSMISNIWGAKSEGGPGPASESAKEDSKVRADEEEQQRGGRDGVDVLQSIVEGMDVFLKTYSDYSGVEDSDGLRVVADDVTSDVPSPPLDEDDEPVVNLSSLSLSPRAPTLSSTTTSTPRPPPSTPTAATPPTAANQPLQFDPTTLLSLLRSPSSAALKTESPKTMTCSSRSQEEPPLPPSAPSPVPSPPAVAEKTMTPRATLDQPFFKISEESMRKTPLLALQASTPLPLKPALSTPHSHSTCQRSDREVFDLSSKFPPAATPQSKTETSPRLSGAVVTSQTPIQPHRLSVSFDTETSVLSGVAYAMTPPRSVRSPPRLPQTGTPHPKRTFSDEEEEEDEGESEDHEDSQRDSDDEDEDEDSEEEDGDVDDEAYMREYMVHHSV